MEGCVQMWYVFILGMDKVKKVFLWSLGNSYMLKHKFV